MIPALAALPALVADPNRALWRDSADASPQPLSLATAALQARAQAPLLCHAPAIARRLGVERFPAFDLLELYAFARPASFCLPTIAGIAAALGRNRAPSETPPCAELAEDLLGLHDLAAALLAEIAASGRNRRRVIGLAHRLARSGWAWSPLVATALAIDAKPAEDASKSAAVPGIAVWEDLPEWSETAPPPAPDHRPIGAAETRARLAQLLGPGAEERVAQADYASALIPAFGPRAEEDAPQVVLAEAGTGIGKTLGYIAPASLWAEKNAGAVWISTYTRHLQHQIDQELDRLYPNPTIKAEKVAIRKGRENYLCLLNLVDLANPAQRDPANDGIAFALMARWVMATRDGDMTGGDLPGWLPELLGPKRVASLADRRGECIHAACPHYSRCFVERSIRRARRADIVIANHALVMIQAALGAEEKRQPTRYVFDEGHHLFSAIDSAFAAHLSGQETSDLRRWLIGGESARASRRQARGLAARLGDLILDDEAARENLDEALDAARALPAEGWLARVTEGKPAGPAEAFFVAIRRQVLARALPAEAKGGHGLECATQPLDSTIAAASVELDRALARLAAPLRDLAARLARRLDEEAAHLDSQARQRLEAMTRQLQRRLESEIAAWRQMLADLAETPAADFVDWFGIARQDGRDQDIGYFRHWVDPTKPFAEIVVKPAHGLVITSATLTDGSGEAESWVAAEARTGLRHLPLPAHRVRVPSPFDYPRQTRIFIATDIDKNDLDQMAAAYRTLFLAAQGGALGLFTAIGRLRAVYQRIVRPLTEAGIPLLAQHVDAMSNATLIDIFRGEIDTCLLGTDAVRDGVDVPGRALRLIVFDRVPWPRPDLLHRARRQAFGGNAYDDQLTRLRLKQAFGRLIRRADDRGVFVLLDKAMPSRLLGAFPPDLTVERRGLAEIVAAIADFLPQV